MSFDDTRIKNNPDKTLLRRIKEYFDTFVRSDYNAMRDHQTDEYTMTDIRKCSLQALTIMNPWLLTPILS